MANSYYQQERAEMAPFLPAACQKVLEIGCGEGSFRALLSQDCEYWGVEPYKNAADIAGQKLSKVINGTYLDALELLPNSYFDLVICNDVIEHMADHDFFFSSIALKLSPGGFIVGSIPNVRWWPNLYNLIIKKDWEYTDDGLLDRTHLRFFTEKSLRRLFKTYNYEIEMFDGIRKKIIKPHSIRKILKILVVRLLGKDSQYLQFAFRVRSSN